MAFSDEYSRVLEALNRHRVDFVICGGLACILHGSTRHTRDMDVAVRMDDANLQRLIAAARELDLQPRIPEPLENLANPEKRNEWIKSKNALVFTLVSLSSPLQVDVFLRYPIAYDELRGNADVMTLGDATIAFSSKRHLIQAKEAVKPARRSDLFDIEFLKELIDREEECG